MILSFIACLFADSIRVSGQLAKYNIIVTHKHPAYDELSETVLSVLNGDLNNSQKFNSSKGEADDAEHPAADTHFVAILHIQRPTPNNCVVQLQLKDPNRDKIVFQDQFTHDIKSPLIQGKFRYIAHKIAQKVLKATHGLDGMFNSQLVAVKRYGPKSYKLVLCDYDGYNEREIVQSPNMILDPKASKCGNLILFRTLNRAQGQRIWLYNLNTNRSRCLSDEIARAGGKNLFGKNISSANFGVTSQHIVFARSSNQTTNIYEFDTATRQVREATHRSKYYIKTCPIYADTHNLLYSSDEDGGEAVYTNHGKLNLNAGFMGRVQFSQPYLRDKRMVCSVRGREEGSGYTGIMYVEDFTNPDKVANARIIMTVPRPGFLEKPRLIGNFVLCRNCYGNNTSLMWIPADAQHNEAFVLKRPFLDADVLPHQLG